ncbi:MAG: ATP-binding protein [Thermodesulfobacteriota bacterium]
MMRDWLYNPEKHFQRFLTAVIGTEHQLEERRRRVLMALFLFIGIPTLYAFGIYHIHNRTFGLALVDIAVATGMGVSLAFLHRIRHAKWLYRICVWLFSALTLIFTARGGPQGSMSLWTFSFPMVAFFLLGKREGGIWVLSQFLGLIILFLSPMPSLMGGVNYHPEFIVRYLISFLVLSSMAFIFESTRFIYQERLNREHSQLQEEQRKLAAAKNRAERANEALLTSMETLRMTQQQLIQTEKMASLGRLVAGVAHEINTPLGIGITAASFLEDISRKLQAQFVSGKMTRTDLEKYIHKNTETSSMILSNLDRAALLVKSFKQVAADRTSETVRKFNLKTYMDQLLCSLQPKIRTTRHMIVMHCPEHIEMESYPGAISQMVTNLIMNSLVHGFDGVAQGEIRMDFRSEGGWISFCYTDNGRGMDKGTLEKIYDPFFTTKRTYGGTGLGMSILYNLVSHSLGGSIECTSTPEQGVVFLIRIPVTVTEKSSISDHCG